MPNDTPRSTLVVAVLALAAAAAVPLSAQYPSDRPGREQGGGGPGGVGRRPAFDPVVIDGPPAPAQFTAIVPLDSAQQVRYATLYQNLMASTQTDRDQVRQARAAREAGTDDPEARRSSRDGMHQTMQTLTDRQKAFDQALRDFMSKEQFKQYQDWRDTQRKEAAARFPRGGRRPGGGSPSQ